MIMQEGNEMKSLFPDICSDLLAESKAFYASLLGFKPVFEIDWYIQLQSPAQESLQIAFVKRDHASVPEGYRLPPQGVVITIEAEAVDAIYQKAKDAGLKIIQ